VITFGEAKRARDQRLREASEGSFKDGKERVDKEAGSSYI
jgi:hypothetical protein